MLEKALEMFPGQGIAFFFLHTNGVRDRVCIMKKGIFLTIVFLFLAQGVFTGGRDTGTIGFLEAAATPVLNVKPIHPLPEWDGPEDLRPRRTAPEEGSSGSRLKISFPVGLLATLLFFLMWKFLQSQE